MRLTILCKGVEHRNAIFELLRGSPQRVRLTTRNLHDFDFDGGIKLSDEIVEMVNRGATVTIVVGESPDDMEKKAQEEEKVQKEPRYRRYLCSLKRIVDTNRVNAYYHQRIHAKVLLAETEGSASAIVTSANFTPTGVKKNCEVGCYLRDLEGEPHMALEEATNEMIELARGHPLKSRLDQMFAQGGTQNVV